MSKLSLVLMFSIWVILSVTPGILAVNYSVTNAAASTKGGARFNKEVGTQFTLTTMKEATEFIWKAFNQNYRESVKQVSLYIVADIAHGEANTIGDKINVSAGYIAGFQGDLKTEIKGIIFSQMTRVWQQNGTGKAPADVLNGIADFMRQKACLVTSHWANPGGGKQWNENSTVTARFFDYWDFIVNKYVRHLNKRMKTGYNENFLTSDTGLDMPSMWYYYQANASLVSTNITCGHK